MIGTSDQSCWLAEACKILLLLSELAPVLLRQVMKDNSQPYCTCDYVSAKSYETVCCSTVSFTQY